MPKILILFAHPSPYKSHVNKALITAAAKLPHVRVHDLYHRYPDFDINIQAEQEALQDADIIIFQHPMYWYSCPAIMKEWMDTVLQHDFAYGENGNQLKGKSWMSVITTGGDQESYREEGQNHYDIQQFLRPFESTAHLCGMVYLTPFITYNAAHLPQNDIDQQAQNYLNRLKALLLEGPTNA